MYFFHGGYMQKHLFLPFVLLLLGGCVSVPESVQLPDSTPLLSYEQVSSEAQEQVDKMARWGGVIANIENKSDKTQLDVVYYPLRAYGRPVVGENSIGRFRVYVDGFLDPMVYQKGRSMTFAGEFTGIEEGLVGEHMYQYPTLQAKGYHLWKDIDRIEIETISVWPLHRFHPYGYRGYYGWQAWHPWSQRHVITRRRTGHRNYESPSDNRNTGGNNSQGSRPSVIEREANRSVRDSSREDQ
jgi:outer membrane lipoprotein